MISDHSGRTFKNLRISLLSACNFACVYCTDDNAALPFSKTDGLSISNLLNQVSKLHHHLNLNSVRLTGGEPLLYPDLGELIKGLSTIGIKEIKMTSNGFLLEKQVQKLAALGLKEINISLDAATEAAFFKMTRRDKFENVKQGIDAALKAGLKVKLNAVIMKGKNDDQIMPLFNFARERNIIIRFLEVMRMGHLHQHQDDYLITQQDILDKIGMYHQFLPLPRKPSATANYWETKDGFTFGIIANSSQPFCQDCDRLRLDHKGNIYGCLSENEPIEISKAVSDNDFEQYLRNALSQKQAVKFTGSKLSMLNIGG
ncbi:GTP 3',8-cyclase MoaA [Pedobacter segetis]|nr:GTP 3',8-cyclase MoaA [Pedobacter segetis]